MKDRMKREKTNFSIWSFLFFFTLISPHLFGDTGFQKKEDSNGRVYRVRRDGTLLFPIDTGYFSVLPSLEEFSIHIAEAKSLESMSEKIRVIQLRKNLSFCSSIADSDEKSKISELILENSLALGKWLSLEKNRIESSLKLESCYFKNRLFLRNEEFSITTQIPTEKLEKKNSSLSESSGNDREVDWTIIRWKKKSPKGKQEINLENALEEWESEIHELPDDSLKITFALSKHRMDEISESFLIGYWEIQRGLTQSTKASNSFSRTKSGDEYRVKYTLSRFGQKKDYTNLEKYVLRNRKGMAIFFQYPKESEKESLEIWNEILQSTKFQGKTLGKTE